MLCALCDTGGSGRYLTGTPLVSALGALALAGALALTGALAGALTGSCSNSQAVTGGERYRQKKDDQH